MPGDRPRCAECLFRTGRDDELINGPSQSFWLAAALARRGLLAQARRTLARAAAVDWVTSYVRSASVPELRRLADHYERQELGEVSELYRLAARLVEEA